MQIGEGGEIPKLSWQLNLARWFSTTENLEQDQLGIQRIARTPCTHT